MLDYTKGPWTYKSQMIGFFPWQGRGGIYRRAGSRMEIIQVLLAFLAENSSSSRWEVPEINSKTG